MKPSNLLTFILFGLAIIHFYWSIGGKLGLSESLPTNELGEKILNPKKIHTAIVGIGLLLFGIFYMIKSGIIEYYLPEWLMNLVSWIIPIIFLLRAIGNFKYVGFFKKVRKTDFGKMDTIFFSPLCLAIAILGIINQLMN